MEYPSDHIILLAHDYLFKGTSGITPVWLSSYTPDVLNCRNRILGSKHQTSQTRLFLHQSAWKLHKIGWVIFLGKLLNYKSLRLKEHTHLKMESVSTSTESHNGVMLPKMEAITWHVVCGGKKGCLRKRNLRDTYTDSVGTTARPSFLVTTLLALVGAEAASVIRAFGSDALPRWTVNCTSKLIDNTVLYFL
jgi:hypothetical protein